MTILKNSIKNLLSLIQVHLIIKIDVKKCVIYQVQESLNLTKSLINFLSKGCQKKLFLI